MLGKAYEEKNDKDLFLEIITLHGIINQFLLEKTIKKDQ